MKPGGHRPTGSIMMPDLPADVPPHRLDEAAIQNNTRVDNLDHKAGLLNDDRSRSAIEFADGTVGELGLVSASLIWVSMSFMLVYLALEFGSPHSYVGIIQCSTVSLFTVQVSLRMLISATLCKDAQLSCGVPTRSGTGGSYAMSLECSDCISLNVLLSVAAVATSLASFCLVAVPSAMDDAFRYMCILAFAAGLCSTLSACISSRHISYESSTEDSRD